MSYSFSEDHEQFRQVVRRFMQEQSPLTAVRALQETEAGFDRAVWQKASGELGIGGLHIPESFGGSGFGAVELGITAEEMGRQLFCGPFFASSVMSATALIHCASDEAKQSLLPALANGESAMSLVLDNVEQVNLIGKSVKATSKGLIGEAGLIVDAHIADQLLIFAEANGQLGLYRVAAREQGVEINPQVTLDTTRRLSTVRFTDVQAENIGDVSANQLQTVWNWICMVLSLEMAGGAQQLLESTIDYTKLRYQFGRPIGSFQGLKHRLADLLMEVEFAKVLAQQAAFCLAHDDQPDYAVSMAKAWVSDTYMKAAREAIQLRGGIGFTWEEDTHFWFKRAKSSEVFMGSPRYHREQLIQCMESNV